MNVKKRNIIIIATVLLLAAIGVTAYAASSYGTSSDPLITKSYLDSTLVPKLEADFQSRLDEKLTEYETQNAGDGTFSVLTLNKGQNVVCGVGCEIMLRIGTASVKAADSPGLVDTTDGSTLDNGRNLTTNHLYMATIDGNGFSATAANVKVLIAGDYTVS